MGLFDFLQKKAPQTRALSSVLPNWSQNASMVSINRGIVTWQGADAQGFVNDGYVSNDIVYSIVNLIANKAKIAPFHVYKIIDQQAASQYKAALQNPEQVKSWKELENLKKKAYELYDGDARLNELLKFQIGRAHV